MDIVITIILLAIFYLVPELLKRRKKVEYQYPDIPDRVPPPASGPVPPPASGPVPPPFQAKSSAIAPAEINITLKATAPVAEVQPVTAPVPEQGPGWQSGLDATAARTGLIYAEILGPPKAKRNNWRR